MWDACRMPWIPELFSAPVVERLQEKWQRERLEAVPYYDGLMSCTTRYGDGSRACGRSRRSSPNGVRGSRRATCQSTASPTRPPSPAASRRWFSALMATGRVAVPVAIVADHGPDGRLDELRIYHSM
jgi:hypothetical protein